MNDIFELVKKIDLDLINGNLNDLEKQEISKKKN